MAGLRDAGIRTFLFAPSPAAGATEPAAVFFPIVRVPAGGNPGEHRIILASDGEQIEVSHRAIARGTDAAGALRAARWLVGRAPGLYTMDMVL